MIMSNGTALSSVVGGVAVGYVMVGQTVVQPCHVEEEVTIHSVGPVQHRRDSPILHQHVAEGVVGVYQPAFLWAVVEQTHHC